jgi:hypothetical protein
MGGEKNGRTAAIGAGVRYRQIGGFIADERWPMSGVAARNMNFTPRASGVPAAKATAVDARLAETASLSSGESMMRRPFRRDPATQPGNAKNRRAAQAMG